MPLSPMDWLMWNMCTVVRNIPFQLIIAAIFKHPCMNVRVNNSERAAGNVSHCVYESENGSFKDGKQILYNSR